MKRSSELVSILSKSFNWDKRRLDCFSKMLLALFKVRTVNLKKLAIGFEGTAQRDSRYKRLKRFFAQFRINQEQLARWAIKLFFADSGKKFYLCIDRTNWFYGKAKINFLFLSVAYEGIAIPLFWTLLPKAGNASAQEHIQIIQRFIRCLGSQQVAGVLGDREFASRALFKWSKKQKVPFYIRVKDNSKIALHKAQKNWTAKKLFKQLKPKEQSSYPYEVILYGVKVYLAGSRSERGELMIFATNQAPTHAIAIYLRRWEIESLFQVLKGRGFQFEETRLTQLDRLSTLMGLLVVGVCWAHKVGEWQAEVKPIPLNKYQNSRRPQYSYFRYGLDSLQEALLQTGQFAKLIYQQCLKLIDIHPNSQLRPAL